MSREQFAKSFSKRKPRSRTARFNLEQLESRQMLAGDLVAHWQAESLNETVEDGKAIVAWQDSIQGIVATGQGTPSLSRGALGGRSVVRFDPADGIDSLLIDERVSPMSGIDDFSIAIAFATTSTDLSGNNGPWYQNTGIVDANSLGFGTGWGLSINSDGQIAVGLEAGFGTPSTTLYSSAIGLNDGELHIVVVTRQANVLSLYVDDVTVDAIETVSSVARGRENDMTFGSLATGGGPFEGSIAEIRFFDGQLTNDEVGNLHDEMFGFYNNQAPMAVDDRYAVDEDAPLFFVSAADGVLANDTDQESNSLSAVLVDDVQHGKLTLRPDGSFFYDPDPDFFGDDVFSYTANDLQASESAQVTIGVRATYDPATAVPDTYELLPSQTLAVEAANGVLANDANPDRSELKVLLSSDVNLGALQLSDDGSFTFDPQGTPGIVSFSYQIDDGTNISEPATVTMIINTIPVAANDSYSTREDASLVVSALNGVLANDFDDDGDMLELTLIDSPENGALNLNADGSFEYYPNADFFGADWFSYRLTDETAISNVAFVEIEVLPVNDSPVAFNDGYAVVPNELLVVSAENGLLANDTDVDSSTLVVEVAESAGDGTLVLNTDGSFTYRPNSGFIGVDSFSYRVSDNLATSSIASVEIEVNTLDQLQPLVINEIHYDPHTNDAPLEFIELKNRSSFTVDLSGWSIEGGVQFSFSENQKLLPSEFLIVAQDPDSLQTEFGVSSVGPWTGRLSSGGESIRLRASSGSLIDEVSYRLGFPWPTVGDEPGPSIQLIDVEIDNDLGGSWRSSEPSPGITNRSIVENSPPHLRQVNHEPQVPSSGQPVAITIKATDADHVSSVTLEYQIVDPGNYIRLDDAEFETSWQSAEMLDDGTNGDSVANDDIYTLIMNGELQQHRRMIRYRITAADSMQNSIRGPYADDPQPNFAYFVYDGVPDWTGADRPGVTDPVTYGSDVMNSLPSYHLIAQNSDVNGSQYSQRFVNRRFFGSLVYDGIVYDHIEYKIRGQFSTYVTGKNKWKLFFNRGHEIRPRDDYGQYWENPVRQLNFGTGASPWARPNRGLSGMDEALAFKFFNLAGVAAPNISAFQFRVIDDEVEVNSADQYDGDLWGLYLVFGDPSASFLDERGLPDGSLFHMKGGESEVEHQGLGLPGDRSDMRAFTSGRTGYTKRNPPQPEDWWRENVDLDTYYSYRSVIEAVNHSDLRDQQNSLLYFNSETEKWTQLPWDLDLLYEEFQRWGPLGVQNASILEQFRLALQHESIRLEYQARMREVEDLLFNPDQAWQAVEEYARYVEPFTSVDRAMWDYHPRTASNRRGYYFRSPATYDGGAAGEVRRELTSPDFEGMINWVKEFIVEGGYGGGLLRAEHIDPAIPETPTVSYLGVDGFPISDLRFQTSAFLDPQGNDTFQAIEWRIAEVTDAAAPAYDPSLPVHYEITPVWESGVIGTFSETIEPDTTSLKIGHAYRVRVRMQDSSGRWSHWSDPVPFVPTSADTDVSSFLRVSEVHYHPADPTPAERSAGYDDSNLFEFIELVNISQNAIDISSAQLVMMDVNGEDQGVAFDFASSGVTRLNAGERVVIVENDEAFAFRYGDAIAIAGQWSGRLNNSGETITLTANGQIVTQFRYEDSWYPTTDGDGPSLQMADIDATDLNAWKLAANWHASRAIHGTPGRADAVPGDANRDGVFNSADLVQVFQAGEYEDSIAGNSIWDEGDWNSDGEFDSADLVAAFQQGNYVAMAENQVLPRKNIFSESRRFDRASRKLHEPVDTPIDPTWQEKMLQR